MKPLNVHELRTYAQYLNELISGSQLQEIISNDSGLALGFYKNKTYWLELSLRPQLPMLYLNSELLHFSKAKKPRPLALFVKSNAHNFYFSQATVKENFGRVLLIELKSQESIFTFEFQMLPRQVNLKAFNASKSIYWNKPQDIEPIQEYQDVESRSVLQINQEWLLFKKSSETKAQLDKLDPQNAWEIQKQKNIQKKKNAIREIEKQLSLDPSATLFELGEHLKVAGLNQLKSEWLPYVDLKASPSQNMQAVFAKAKQIEAKRAGTLQRLELLYQEIERLQKSQFQETQQKGTPLVDLMSQVEVKGRKLQLGSGAIAYCGRSAKDNLDLLRKAKAWDLWFHLKDYPGAHAIIHRKKDQELQQSELQQVAQWLAKESINKKNWLAGGKLLVVMVECRHVKPIKGDKLGRVIYHNEKTFSVIL